MGKAKGNGSRGLYNRVMGLKRGKAAKDPECRGLRYVARKLSDGRVAVYGQLRYRHPLTGKDTTIGDLGRVPTMFELEVEALAAGPSAGVLMAQFDDLLQGRGPEGSDVDPDYHAFAAIRAKAREKLALVKSGVDPKGVAGPSGVTLEQAIEQHVNEPRAAPLAPRTVRYYRTMSKRYLGPVLKAPLRRLDSTELNKLHKKLLSEHGSSVALMCLRIVKAAWGTAASYDAKLGRFPVMKRGAMKAPPPKKSAIKRSGLPKWFRELRAMKNEQRRDLYLLGVMTALRARDLCTIRREHFDAKRCVLLVPKPKGGPSKAFELPLSDVACDLIKRVLRSHNSVWLWPSSRSKSGHIEHAEPVPDDGFTTKWTLHDLRRIWGSAAAAEGLNLYHHKALKNHALPRGDVTAGYIELEPEDLRPSQQRVTDRLRREGLWL